MSFDIVPGYDRPEEVRALFTEYTRMLVEGSPDFAQYLVIQNYDEEIAHLEKKYGRPAGRLYLALAEGQGVGCIALRRLDDERCEMKRLYVRPAYRGSGLGGELVRRVIDDARAIGYRHMLLDTLPSLQSAVRMYRALGFYDIPCYNDSPVDDTIFLQLDL